MTYNGSVGSVNVLELLSEDLFDESQENPSLLDQSTSRPNSPKYKQTFSPRSHSPAKIYFSGKQEQSRESTECLLSDSNSHSIAQKMSSPVKLLAPKDITQSQQCAPSSTYFSALNNSILTSSTKTTDDGDSKPRCSKTARGEIPLAKDDDKANLAQYEDELRLLLRSLNRIALSTRNESDDSQYPVCPKSNPIQSPREKTNQGFMHTREISDQAVDTLLSSIRPASAPQKREISNSQNRQVSFNNKTSMQRESISNEKTFEGISFNKIGRLLRGGGASGTSRTRSEAIQRRKPTRSKSMGTICSKMKMREKFVTPTILTDARYRVSVMKLGTSPMRACVKHLPFPYCWKDGTSYKVDDSPAYSPPKGALYQNSFVPLDLVDKIGTRAACPLALIREKKPNYDSIQPRVDSWNPYMQSKQPLRRPSQWLESDMILSSPMSSPTKSLNGDYVDY